MLRDYSTLRFNMLLQSDLLPTDNTELVRRTIDQLAARNAMLRSTFVPPIFSIEQRSNYLLEEVHLGALADLPRTATKFRDAEIDIATCVFKALICYVRGHASCVLLSIARLVLDGRSQTFLSQQFAELLVHERDGQELMPIGDALAFPRYALRQHFQLQCDRGPFCEWLSPHVSPTVDRTLDLAYFERHHLPKNEALNHPSWPALLKMHMALFNQDLSIVDECRAAPAYAFEKRPRVVTRSLPVQVYTTLQRQAIRSGLTANSVLLGTLATCLHELTGDTQFAISQTYAGRQTADMNIVGSFSVPAPILFSFPAKGLASTCRHAIQATQRSLGLGVNDLILEACKTTCNILYEFNDCRPSNLGHSNPLPVIADFFFTVCLYKDALTVEVLFDDDLYMGVQVESLLAKWVEVWMEFSL